MQKLEPIYENENYDKISALSGASDRRGA